LVDLVAGRPLTKASERLLRIAPENLVQIADAHGVTISLGQRRPPGIHTDAGGSRSGLGAGLHREHTLRAKHPTGRGTSGSPPPHPTIRTTGSVPVARGLSFQVPHPSKGPLALAGRRFRAGRTENR